MPAPFKRIVNLDEPLHSELHERILRGESTRRVAMWAQACGQWTDVPLRALERQIARYRERVVLPAIANGTHKLPEEATRIDVIRHLNRLILRQKARLAKVERIERHAPMPIPAVSAEMERLHDLLWTLARLQLETGAIPRADRSVTKIITLEHAGGVSDPRVVSFRVEDDHMAHLRLPSP